MTALISKTMFPIGHGGLYLQSQPSGGGGRNTKKFKVILGYIVSLRIDSLALYETTYLKERERDRQRETEIHTETQTDRQRCSMSLREKHRRKNRSDTKKETHSERLREKVR
ncbi:hypothetical protein ACQP3D_25320, partial [Escherichia coli]